MRFLFPVLCILMLSCPAFAATQYDILFEEFDARPLQVEEKRLLQTALAFQGY